MTRTRQPTTPGEILAEEFLGPLGITQKRLAPVDLAIEELHKIQPSAQL